MICCVRKNTSGTKNVWDETSSTITLSPERSLTGGVLQG